MINRLVYILLISLSLTSCDYLIEYYSKKELEKIVEQGGFIETEEDRKLKEEILNGIEPVRLEEYPQKLESELKNYVTEKFGDTSNYNYVVYFNTVIEYSPDTTGYLDTNHYAINLEVYTLHDTTETYLQFTKDIELIFDFEL